MYNALNEDYMFQEMHDRVARIERPPPSPARHRDGAEPQVVAQGGSHCAMIADVRIDRSRTESIVGRAAELEDLLRTASGADGTRMVLLSGDAGVGKTRLLTEALDRLAEQGWHRLIGHCLDFGETSMPYLPFAEMLGQVGQERADASRTDPVAPPGARGRALGGARPCRGVRGGLLAVEQLATDRPVVMVVEDAHWADASTRDLISFLLSRRSQGRFLLVVTFRSDEMHRRHPLRQRVAEWVRLPGVERIQLDPLPPGAVRGMVEQLISSPEEVLGARYDEDIARIVQRSQGNAFYVEELVGAFLGGGWSLPEDLADLLLVRLDRLEESRARRRTGGIGSRPTGVARPARRGCPGDRGRARRSRCAGRSTRTCSCGRVRRSTPSGMPSSVRRCTTTCYPVNGCGCTRRTPLQCASSMARREPPTWPVTRWPRTTCPPPWRPVSTRATRRWARAARTRRTPLHEGAGDLRARGVPARGPAGRVRARGADRRRAVQRGSTGDGARTHRLPSLPALQRHPSSVEGTPAPCARRGAALDRDRRPSQPRERGGARAGRPGGDPAARADPVHARVCPGLGRPVR